MGTPNRQRCRCSKDGLSLEEDGFSLMGRKIKVERQN